MPKKVYIAICSGRDWKAPFGASVCRMVHQSAMTPDLDIFVNVLQGNGISRARQMAIADAKAGGFTHILFLDDDMKFPPSLLIDLLAHNLPIMSINYARKEIGSKLGLTHGIDGAPVFSRDKTGIEEVGWVGFGGILIQLDKLDGLEDPFFEQRWLPERKDFLTEDSYFCMKVRTHGLTIHIDHDLSNKCAHIGDFAYREAN